MKELQPKLVPATINDYSVIQNMARFYAYDISRYCGQSYEGWEFPETGLYECTDFLHYFNKPDNHVFFIKVNEELAGFAIVDTFPKLPEVAFNMGQFYIVAKYQRSGIGKQAAKLLFDQFPGEWSVGVIPENTRALHFWRQVIEEYTHGNFTEITKSSEELKTPEHPDPFPNIIFRFNSSLA